MLLNSSTARKIAEARWGVGGTTSYKSNRKGAYYFACAGHGGFVVSASALSKEEYATLSEYVETFSTDYYISNGTNKVLLAMHAFRTRSSSLRGVGSSGYRVEKEEFFLFEEDCDWSLLVKFAGIMTGDMTKEKAEEIFYSWFDMGNPKVANRKKVDELRKNGDADLIIAASSVGEGRVKVWTADQKQYIVEGYDKARDEYNEPYLSRCKVLEAA
jgi:hypothetical protein